MAFVVEDGTRVPGANSYASVEFADAYFAERGNGVWEAIVDVADKERYLIQATDYIELIYGRRFIGEMVATDQSLSWPRQGTAYPTNAIPLTLQKATAEYAVRAINGPLLPDPSVDANGFASVVTKKVVGPIEKEFQVMGSGRARLVRAYPAADAYMVGLLVPFSGNRVTR